MTPKKQKSAREKKISPRNYYPRIKMADMKRARKNYISQNGKKLIRLIKYFHRK